MTPESEQEKGRLLERVIELVRALPEEKLKILCSQLLDDSSETVALADVQATLDLHVAMGTVEKFEDGTYTNVPRERLTSKQLAWLEVQRGRGDKWLRHSDPRGSA